MISEISCGEVKTDKFILSHLRGFELRNKYKFDLYFILESSLFILSFAFSILFFYTSINNSSYRLPAALFLGTSITTCFIIGRAIQSRIRKVRLSNIDSDEELFTFLCKYGETVEGNIVPNKNPSDKSLHYVFEHNELRIHGEFYFPNNYKIKVQERIEVRHWKGIIHFPIINPIQNGSS